MNILLNRLKEEFPPEWKELISYVEENADRLPNPKRALIYIEKLFNSMNGEFPEKLNKEFLFHLIELFSASRFLSEFLVRHRELLKKLETTYRKTFLPKDFAFQPETSDRRTFMKEIRIFKHFHMARIVLRNLLDLAPFQELVRDVTLVHDACIKAAYTFAYNELIKRYGTPSSTFTVIDMGKAGGFELNYSSDVDLIYIYGSRYGETTGGSYGRLQNHDFFTLLAREVTGLLSERTPEGICFPVDTRLRPNGTMGPLVNDIEALEQYYTAVARPWERFALLKARPSAGDITGTGIEFLELARSFVFQKYIDISLIEEVLKLKKRIKAKVRKKGNKIDLKLGMGGIREIEFIVQAFQLIYGGKFPQIRSRNTLIALKRLYRWGFLTEEEFKSLQSAYIFLRRCEHMLQITEFHQTQTFHPESEEALELARKMGFRTREEFLNELNRTAKTVNSYFTRFFPTGDRKTLSSFKEEELAKLGFKELKEVKHFIETLLSMRTLLPEEKSQLDTAGDRFLKLILTTPSPITALKNLTLFLESEEGKLFFFSYLSHENIMKLLLFLLSTREFFISRFRKTPELLEYIFQPQLIENRVTENTFKGLQQQLQNLQLTKNTFETVALLRKRLGRTAVEEFLSEITAVCDGVLSEIYNETSPSFSIASVGKHGSREMNIGSDLDLLFVAHSPLHKNREDAIKLIKKLESMGYEVDTRLRPFGEKGELVFTVDYLKNYLKETARLWERLAFTRFRFLLGNLKAEVENTVREFLFGKPLDSETLEGIISMRRKLETELGRKEPLKYGTGGIADLEFVSYTYQLLSGRWLRHTLTSLKALAEEDKRFEKGTHLYRNLRQVETESRLFLSPSTADDRIGELRSAVRSFYLEFMAWMRSRV